MAPSDAEGFTFDISDTVGEAYIGAVDLVVGERKTRLRITHSNLTGG